MVTDIKLEPREDDQRRSVPILCNRSVLFDKMGEEPFSRIDFSAEIVVHNSDAIEAKVVAIIEKLPRRDL